jgi:hypothetical protein
MAKRIRSAVVAAPSLALIWCNRLVADADRVGDLQQGSSPGPGAAGSPTHGTTVLSEGVRRSDPNSARPLGTRLTVLIY